MIIEELKLQSSKYDIINLLLTFMTNSSFCGKKKRRKQEICVKINWDEFTDSCQLQNIQEPVTDEKPIWCCKAYKQRLRNQIS